MCKWDLAYQKVKKKYFTYWLEGKLLYNIGGQNGNKEIQFDGMQIEKMENAVK